MRLMANVIFISTFVVAFLLATVFATCILTAIFVGDFKQAVQLLKLTTKISFSHKRRKQVIRIVTHFANEPRFFKGRKYNLTRNEVGKILHFIHFFDFYNLLIVLININSDINKRYAHFQLNNLSDYAKLISATKDGVYNVWQDDVKPWLKSELS